MEYVNRRSADALYHRAGNSCRVWLLRECFALPPFWPQRLDREGCRGALAATNGPTKRFMFCRVLTQNQ